MCNSTYIFETFQNFYAELNSVFECDNLKQNTKQVVCIIEMSVLERGLY